MKKFLTVCLHPVLQRTCELEQLQENQVNRCLSQRMDASGKGVNVTRVLQQMGREVVHLTQAGGVFRDYFLMLAEQDHLCVKWVDSESEIRTCCTLISHSQHTCTEIVEEAPPVGPRTDALIRTRFLELLPEAQMLILSGSQAPGFNEDIFPWMVQTAKSRSIPVLADYRGSALLGSLPFQPDLIKPNRQEFVDTFFPRRNPITENLIHQKMLELYEQGIQVVLTNGAGSVWYTHHAEIAYYNVAAIEPLNAIGSGDAFAAGLASVWAESRDLVKALDKAVWCGRQNALRLRPGVLF